MKKILIFLFFLISNSNSWGQLIFNRDNVAGSKFDLVKIARGEKVLIVEHTEIDKNYEGTQYFNANDSIGVVYTTFPAKDEMSKPLRDSLQLSHPYPEFIRIKNNEFKLSRSMPWDSLVCDNKGRVLKAFSNDIENGKFYYPDSNTIIIADEKSGKRAEEVFTTVIRYRLDNNKNILLMEYGDISKSDFVLRDTSKVVMEANEEYSYGKHDNIVEIRINFLRAKTHLQSIQKFYYKNGRPHKSKFYDARQGKTTYWFDYYYGKMSEPDLVFYQKFKPHGKKIIRQRMKKER